MTTLSREYRLLLKRAFLKTKTPWRKTLFSSPPTPDSKNRSVPPLECFLIALKKKVATGPISSCLETRPLFSTSGPGIDVDSNRRDACLARHLSVRPRMEISYTCDCLGSATPEAIVRSPLGAGVNAADSNFCADHNRQHGQGSMPRALTSCTALHGLELPPIFERGDACSATKLLSVIPLTAHRTDINNNHLFGTVAAESHDHASRADGGNRVRLEGNMISSSHLVPHSFSAFNSDTPDSTGSLPFLTAALSPEQARITRIENILPNSSGNIFSSSNAADELAEMAHTRLDSPLHGAAKFLPVLNFDFINRYFIFEKTQGLHSMKSQLRWLAVVAFFLLVATPASDTFFPHNGSHPKPP